jgi:glycerol-3-phosphate dehydrogenase
MHELNNSKLKVDMPIMEAVYGIIYENKSAQQEINRLCEKLI